LQVREVICGAAGTEGSEEFLVRTEP